MPEDPTILSALMVILGGLSLFLLGMRTMTQGLKAAAGERIRQVLSVATRNRAAGYGLGTTLGFLMHSSAASVMTVGFVNAGLLGLLGALPILFGLNLGTTLSMQLISFRLTDLAYVFLFLGFFLQLILPAGWWREGAKGLMGFGMLFLGMDLMGSQLEVFREDLAPHLTRIDGATWTGMLLGILVAALITGILQSSGAVIGMTFVMIEAGLFTSLEQVYPIILGAHIGTSVTALLGCIGTHIEARRTAVANLFFNLFNVLLGVLLAPLFIALIVWWSDDVVRQAAHAHTLVMLVAGLVLLPVVVGYVRVVRKVTPSQSPIPSSSHLDPTLFPRPEAALRAVLREIHRSLEVTRSSLRLAGVLQGRAKRKYFRRMQLNESVLNELKGATRDYLTQMTRHYLSRRQALMVQYLTRAAVNIERIGDHLLAMGELVMEYKAKGRIRLSTKARMRLRELMEQAGEVLERLERGLDPENRDYTRHADLILEARDVFSENAEKTESWFNHKVANHEEDPLTGLYFSETVLALSRLVRHAKVVALEMKQPFFAVKDRKLEKVVPIERRLY
ncbi:MAG: Na/Pi cotransporter family protein [Opitutales bacterium]|nr:Na/Pi cotransporter family protein [Opitutales bacterium]MCH8541345.1 Na/Pi symporter [Opitutales bacterium]